MIERKKANIAIFSCLPWIDFDSFTLTVDFPHETSPLIHWGKVNENYEMTVVLTVNHIFVNGLEASKFYKNAQENFNTLL